MSISRALLRHKALLAASSVVLAMTACVGGDEAKTDDTQAVITDTSGDTQDSQPVDTDPADTNVTDTSVADTSAQGDCNSVPSEEVTECCDALRAACEAEHGAGTDAANECIFGEDFSGSTGCIPWGPPVPPKARRAFV
ncbi:hypothetical protein L6R46_21075 [Myxococcota bacterium]|nr:hypothetical protein [Myxococcota bacterium]